MALLLIVSYLLLLAGEPIKFLVKKFKVTDTQILRIKREENWLHVKPAKHNIQVNV